MALGACGATPRDAATTNNKGFAAFIRVFRVFRVRYSVEALSLRCTRERDAASRIVLVAGGLVGAGSHAPAA